MALPFSVHGVRKLLTQTGAASLRCNVPIRNWQPGTVVSTRGISFSHNASRLRDHRLGKSVFSWGSLRSQSTRVPGESRMPFTWKSVGVTVGLAGLLWGGMKYVQHEKEEATRKLRQEQIGKAKIGGEWELTDHNGEPRTSKDFHGSWILLYFGFTHCPDICPDEIEKLLETTTLLEKAIPDIKIQPLFITVDPERDSCEAVKRYVKEFSPRLLGLTGTREQINKAAKAFRVYYSAAPEDGDNDYIVDHTIIIYLIDPAGQFVDYYGQNKTAKQMAENIEGKYNRFSYLRWNL